MHIQPLAAVSGSLQDGFVQADATAAEASRLRLAFSGGAFAVMATLQKAIPLGEEAVMSVIDSEIQREARFAGG